MTQSCSTTRRGSTARSCARSSTQYGADDVARAPRRARRRAAHAQRTRRGPHAARRVRAMRRPLPRRHPRHVRAPVLLRLRGRRPDVGARVRARVPRHPARRDVRVRPRPLGRARRHARCCPKRGSSSSAASSRPPTSARSPTINALALWGSEMFADTVAAQSDDAPLADRHRRERRRGASTTRSSAPTTRRPIVLTHGAGGIARGLVPAGAGARRRRLPRRHVGLPRLRQLDVPQRRARQRRPRSPT